MVALATSLSFGCGEADDDGDVPAEWPKRVTLQSPAFVMAGDPLSLADGEIVAVGGGDIELYLSVQLALQSSTNDADEAFCVQGTYAALADVPTDESTCPGHNTGRWSSRMFMSGAAFHTEESGSVGLSALVRNAAHDAVYRLRTLGDSVSPNAEGALGTATATFEYEPVP